MSCISPCPPASAPACCSGRRLVGGTRSLAEIGHTVIDHAAGLRGEPASFEELASGTALERRTAHSALPADGGRIVALVRDGDPAATRIWDETSGSPPTATRTGT